METKDVIVVKSPAIKSIELKIFGTQPLIMHKWGQKAIEQMKDTQNKKASSREIRDPQQEYKDSMYVTADGRYGFPTTGFKKAIIRAAQYANMKMTFLRGALFIEDQLFSEEQGHPVGLVEIIGEPKMREDLVKVGMGKPDFRYRGQFDNWKATLGILYNSNVISPEQVLNLVLIAGFSVGVGEWRPERDGQFGTFAIKEH